MAAEALGLAPPFAIMASNTMEMVEDQLCPVRHYSWGTCMPLMKEHSDAYFFRWALSRVLLVLSWEGVLWTVVFHCS